MRYRKSEDDESISVLLKDPLREVRDDPRVMEDLADSASDEEKTYASIKGPDITDVSSQLRAYLYHSPPLHPRR